SMENDTDTDLIDYPDESGTDDEDPEDEDEDPEEDPSEEHNLEDEDEDPEEDPNEEHKPEDEDEPSEDSDKTEPFEENETAATTPHLHLDHLRLGSLFLRHVFVGHGRLSDLIHLSMIHMRDDIPEEDMPPRRRFVLTALPHGCDVVESSAAAARAPRGQYDFVDTIKARQGLMCSPGHDARTIARAADRAEDVGYVRALPTSEHRVMTSIEEVNLRVSYQAQVRMKESEDFYTQLLDARTDRRDIRLKIDVVRGQRTAYET
ncbi:hypothetical protein Tco_0135733, partial [Tanacetum coccineum]